MALNAQVEALLAMFAQMPPVDFAAISARALREINDQRPMQMGPPPAVAIVEDLALDLAGRTIPARLYVPEGSGENPPLVIYYHGGGWVIGTLDTHDGTCRALARASGAAVLSIGYRLAPEHPSRPRSTIATTRSSGRGTMPPIWEWTAPGSPWRGQRRWQPGGGGGDPRARRRRTGAAPPVADLSRHRCRFLAAILCRQRRRAVFPLHRRHALVLGPVCRNRG
jgi:hypothetical protein